MIYLDNAATTFPKPENVYQRVDWANRNLAVNAGRGSYKAARQATKLIDETRDMLVKLVHGAGVENVILTPSATIALHMVLQGLDLKKGDTVYVSPYEHNAVARTLQKIVDEKEIMIKELPLTPATLEIDLEKMRYMFIKDHPVCVCCTHVSNVTGYILPVQEVFSIAKEYQAVTVMDAAQSFGLVDIDITMINADFVVFAGHKTLYSPFGVGGFVDNSKSKLNVSIAGGTGSDSLNLHMPKEEPLRFEPASKNIVAIAGLHEALKTFNINEYFKIEKELTKYIVHSLKTISGVELYAPSEENKHIGVISFNVEGYNAEDIGMILDEDYDIAVRTGYHCAPYIHKYLNDEKYLGTVRVGISRFTTKKDIDLLVNAIREVSEE